MNEYDLPGSIPHTFGARAVHHTVYCMVLEARRDGYGYEPYRTDVPYTVLMDHLAPLATTVGVINA